MEQIGHKINWYDNPKKDKLADGSVQSIILDYSIVDVELVTRVGKVILARTHVDVIQGPEEELLLYVGEAEEKRLKLRSFADQIEDLAKRIGLAAKTKRKSPDFETARVAEAGKCFRQQSTESGTGYTASGKVVQGDGYAYVGEQDWWSQTQTEYLFEPLAEDCYITTAALADSKGLEREGLPEGGVAATDLEPAIRRWLGGREAVENYTARIVTTL